LLAPANTAEANKELHEHAIPKFLSATATVDKAAIRPLPKSRKIYVEGSSPDIRAPTRAGADMVGAISSVYDAQLIDAAMHEFTHLFTQ
jgi:hypothetical protein